MEGLVNYSSEDELDESNYKKAAERAGASRGKSAAAKKRKRSSSGGSSSSAGVRRPSPYPPYAKGDGGMAAGGGSNGRGSYREEESFKHKSGGAAAGRSYHGRGGSGGNGGRDNRDYRQSRGDAKETRNDDRDYRGSDTNRSKDYNRQSSSFSSHHNKDRPRAAAGSSYSRHSESFASSSSSSSRHSRHHHNDNHQNRFRDERGGRFEDRGGGGGERSAHRPRRRRSGDSRSPSPPTAAAQHYHNKRGSRHGDQSKSRQYSGGGATHRDSRSRSRSPSGKARDRRFSAAPPQPLEQARLSALEMERKLISEEGALNSPTRVEAPLKVPLLETPQQPPRLQPLMSLPLSDMAPKLPPLIAVAPPLYSSSGVGAARNSGATAEPAVIQLPSYYNPSVINPTKYAEQVQKRKLLWGAKKAEDTSAKWGHAQFSQDSDGKVASKFMRLMGIKGGAAAKSEDGGGGVGGAERERTAVATPSVSVAPDVKSREAMFSTMEQQYEVARQVTHTMRGVGLGFSSQGRPL